MVRDGARTFTNDYFVRNRRKKDAEELGNIAMLCICLYTIHTSGYSYLLYAVFFIAYDPTKHCMLWPSNLFHFVTEHSQIQTNTTQYYQAL